jgi:hypothetical protein
MTRLWAGRPWFSSRKEWGCNVFSFAIECKLDLRPTQPPNKWDIGANFPRIRRSRREDDQSHTYNVEVSNACSVYECVSKSFRTGRLERELQMAELSATRYSCIAILWVNLVSFVAITLCVASQRVITKVSVYFVIDSVRKLLDTPSYINSPLSKSSWCGA